VPFIVCVPPSPLPFCNSPPSICSPICSPSLLFTSFSLSVMPHRQRLCDWLSGRKLHFWCKPIGAPPPPPHHQSLLLYSVQRGRLLALKNAPPLRIQRRVSQQTAGPNGTTGLMRSTHSVHTDKSTLTHPHKHTHKHAFLINPPKSSALFVCSTV